jgi:hypothetical protein
MYYWLPCAAVASAALLSGRYTKIQNQIAIGISILKVEPQSNFSGKERRSQYHHLEKKMCAVSVTPKLLKLKVGLMGLKYVFIRYYNYIYVLRNIVVLVIKLVISTWSSLDFCRRRPVSLSGKKSSKIFLKVRQHVN